MRTLFILFLFASSALIAQQKDYTHSLQGIKKVEIRTGSATKVVATNTNKLVLKNYHSNHCDDCKNDHKHSQTNHKKRKHDKAKGLKAIYPGGNDNTNGFGFSITREGSTLIVKDLKSYLQRHAIQIELPKTMNIFVDSGNLGNINIEGFTSEVEAESNVGPIRIKDVTGPITAHSSTGSINVKFVKVNQSSPISISSSVGEIDVALPSNTKANLDIKTNGTVYTSFDLKAPPKKGLKHVGGSRRITGAINNGGVKIKLKSSMGNIYLRKK